MTHDVPDYGATDPSESLSSLFAGGRPIGEAIEQLRTRLLDLSARNSLLNFRHPRGKCVQFCDRPDLDATFDRLFVEGKPAAILPVREPPADTYEGVRPDAKSHAQASGITTSFDCLPHDGEGVQRRLTGLQALMYPAELEKQLRKTAGDANTAIEETGSNMLFLMFGFLEFFDSQDSERGMLAPLIALPVELQKGGINLLTRTYDYSIQHNGEDVAENQTLREKLQRDFLLRLPDFDEEERPEAFFQRVEEAVSTKSRWRVRRQVTLGMLSFGKLAIWADLDTRKNPGLLTHPLLTSVFSGEGSRGGSAAIHAPDYHLDTTTDPVPQLVFDADSSQHSAIMDVLAGKNLVINGPPGTGKSQTITNIVAAALAEGKKVLFVAEKLAALEVVRHRLDKAKLGQFCLELHSHKTQKKKFIEDISLRLTSSFPPPAQFQAKSATLLRQKQELARHAALMGSRIGNRLDLSVNEIFWAAERRRLQLGSVAAVVNTYTLGEAALWTMDDLQLRASRLRDLAVAHGEIGKFDVSHPFWGFMPTPLAPADDDAILRILVAAQHAAAQSAEILEKAQKDFDLVQDMGQNEVRQVCEVLDNVPAFPLGGLVDLVDNLCASRDEDAVTLLAEQMRDGIRGIQHARELDGKASQVFQTTDVEVERLLLLVEDCRKGLSSTFLDLSCRDAVSVLKRFDAAREHFLATAEVLGLGTQSALNIPPSFVEAAGPLSTDTISTIPLREIKEAHGRVEHAYQRLSASLNAVRLICERHKFPFDSTDASVVALSDPSRLAGLQPSEPINDEVLTGAKRFLSFPLADRPIDEIVRIASELNGLVATCESALAGSRFVMDRFGVEFEGNSKSLDESDLLAAIALDAPPELLDFRVDSLGSNLASDLVERLSQDLSKLARMREALDPIFHLDALPTPSDVRSAVFTLRAKDGLLAMFDGRVRQARALHAGLAAGKKKDPRSRSEQLAMLVDWMELRQSIEQNELYALHLGALFRGAESDISRIQILNGWASRSRKLLLQSPGLIDKVKLSMVSSERVSEVAARAAQVRASISELAQVDATVRGIVGTDVAGFREARVLGWEGGLEKLRKAAQACETVASFFRTRAVGSLSPRETASLMEVRRALDQAAPDLEILASGKRLLSEAAGETASFLVRTDVDGWQARFRDVRHAMELADQAAQLASTFVPSHVSLSQARQLASEAADLESAWRSVGSSKFRWTSSSLESIRQDGSRLSKLATEAVEMLRSCAKDGQTIGDLTGAVQALSLSDRILKDQVETGPFPSMLGPAYQGKSTDLDVVGATLDWARETRQLSLPPGLRSLILSARTVSVVRDAKAAFQDIQAGLQRTEMEVQKLVAFGDLNHAQWYALPMGTPVDSTPHFISDRLQRAVRGVEGVLAWSKYVDLRKRAMSEGLAQFVIALEAGEVGPPHLSLAFELTAFQSIGRSIYQSNPDLPAFNGTVHDAVRADYKKLDAEIIELTGKEFAHRIDSAKQVPSGTRGAVVGDFTELHLLRREINKKSRHVPIRQLMRRAGQALQQLKPCFMMGPLSVAQYLEQGALKFDLIVMDEASQLRPEEALGAIARGTQLVVVGDPKQLPPTNFFNRMVDGGDEDEDESAAVATGMESILDICQQLFTPVRSLRWHYRSQHQSLIAFSNHHFYKNLVVFPSPYANDPWLGVKYRFVTSGSYRDRRNLPEAQQVVDAVLAHIVKRPQESLGVVTLNQTQRDLIEELLDKSLQSLKGGQDFIAHWEAKGWPFFIKNLENVQGDERDVIMISTTFGRMEGSHAVRQNFGPISRPDGWRRLNVLFTRARRRIELFTSMQPGDIVVGEGTPAGTKALRDYLDFAKRGVLTTTDEGVREPDSDFEVAVAKVITELGYQVVPQLGVAGFFIDMAVRNPDRPGEYLAAIECDGAAYHSGFSVRDRDRIRQEILETLGWRGRIYRIWSTDWFYDPKRQTARLVAFLSDRRRMAAQELRPTDEETDWVESISSPPSIPEERAVDAPNVVQEQSPPVMDSLFQELPDAIGSGAKRGDSVTYCYDDKPHQTLTYYIPYPAVSQRRNRPEVPNPVEVALLGKRVGETATVVVFGKPYRSIRILAIVVP